MLAWSFVRGYGTLGATIERGGLNVVCRISTTTILALSDVKLVLKSLVVGLLLVLVGVLEAVRSRFAVAKGRRCQKREGYVEAGKVRSGKVSQGKQRNTREQNAVAGDRHDWIVFIWGWDNRILFCFGAT